LFSSRLISGTQSIVKPPTPAAPTIRTTTGEIIPQAVCSRHGVAIGAALAPIVRALMWLFAPITWPLGKLLDCVLGHEDVVMKRNQLKAMVQLHGEGAGERMRVVWVGVVRT